ncbi:MAG TPA: hypothetical protein VGL98_15410 [Gammaproteobacteria bacterium]
MNSGYGPTVSWGISTQLPGVVVVVVVVDVVVPLVAPVVEPVLVAPPEPPLLQPTAERRAVCGEMAPDPLVKRRARCDRSIHDHCLSFS